MPLNNNFENKCKSDIKYVEASSLGVVSIASNCVYDLIIQNGINGYIAEDDAWENVLNVLLSTHDRSELSRIAANALDYVSKNRVERSVVKKRLTWYASI